LLDPDPIKRKASLDLLQRTVQVAAEWGALYVVIHFGGLHSDGLSRAEVLELADQAAAQLDAWACELHMPVHIEYSAYNPSFATPEDHAALVSRYAHIDVCLDVGHARVGAEMLGIDEWAVVQALAPHTRSMHLWTARDREDIGRYHHVPVHPTLTASEGWIDIPRLLDVVLTRQPDCAVVFEPDSLYNSDPAWRAEGVSWVRDLVAPYRSRGQARDASVTGVVDA
jgi:sugar phosphate isomerase/epimerase